jgi:phage tail-like protein
MIGMSAVGAGEPTVVGASVFVLEVDGVQVATFAELSSMSSEVTPTAYVATGSEGVSHTQQFGQATPPQVTLKRGLDTDTYLWAWHQAVLQGNPAARRTCSLLLFASGQSPKTGKPVTTYVLENAWVAKMDISGMAAGGSEVVMETVTLICDQILMQPAG